MNSDKLVMKIKMCAKCRIEKSELEFYPHGKRLASYCKECAKEERRVWYQNNGDKERLREKSKRDSQRGNMDSTFGTHKCNGCGECEPNVFFNLRKVKGKLYKRHLCRDCFNSREKNAKPRKKKTEEALARSALYEKFYRTQRHNVPRYIVQDSRQTDRRKGRDNDLDVGFVSLFLADHTCSYCGEKELRMTLDRIDNFRGHTRDNVIAACIRCNSIRANMPYLAWMEIVPAVRDARHKGLFGGWESRFIKAVAPPEKSPRNPIFLPHDEWMLVEVHNPDVA